MARKDLVETLEMPSGIKVAKEGTSLVVSGKKGTIKRVFDNPKVSVEVSGNEVKFVSNNATKQEKTIIKTFKAHLKNIIKGCNEGYIYKLKICSGHFPINVTVSGSLLQIKNYLGEKVPREVKVKEGAKITIEGSMITVEAVNKEVAGQVAADIELATRRPGFDRRIFQDGIYIIDKAGQVI